MDKRLSVSFLHGLDNQELMVLQVAAVLGESFRLEHLLELTSLKPSILFELIRKFMKNKFIVKSSRNGEDGYFFVNKKFPQTILEAMKDETRELLLSKIILFLEKELPDHDEKQLMLANLYLKYGRNNRAGLQHMRKAADFLISAHKTKEGLDLYDEILHGFTETTDMNRSNSLESMVFFIDCVISYAPIAINLRPPEIILPIIIKAKSYAKDLKNKRALAMLELCLGRLYQSQGNSNKASAHYNEGWSLAQGTGDKALLKRTSKLAALTLFWQGKMIDAIQMYEHNIGDIEEISLDLQDTWAHLMLAYCYGITGRIARGIGLAEAIREIAISKGNLKTQAFADAIIALILLEVRQLEKAAIYINSALAIGERINNDTVLWMAKPCKAYELYSRGDLKKAQETLESAMNHARALGQVHYPSPWIIEILWSLHKAKLEPIKGYSFPSEIARLTNWPDIYMKGAALRYHLLDKRTAKADSEGLIRILEESQKLLMEAGTRIELGRTQIELARLLVEKKHIKKAKEIAHIGYRNLSEIDASLFPSELLSLIDMEPKEDRILHGLHAISKLGGTIDFQSGYKSYLGKVITLITDMFAAERSAIFLMQDEQPDAPFNIAAARNFSTKELDQLIMSPMRDLMLTTMQKKEPLVITDTENNLNLLPSGVGKFSIKSIACIPLLVTGKAIGLLYADNRLLEGVFSKGDTIIMHAIATQVALFLKTTTIYREFKDFRGEDEDVSFHQDDTEFPTEFPQVIGKSQAIKDVLNKVQKVSETDAAVLILGETGVGKELIAHAIHQHSARANKAFITVNVSALSENLLTSELFGHEKGAFTSAEHRKIGRFEMANEGTIFLDEIGDLSIEAQVKLLRVLQEGRFERVGGTQVIHTDFRLIAATNRNLIEMVAKGDFRSDLFYRINTFPIEIPPLRKRKEEIPKLARYFVKRYAKKHRKKIKKIPESEMKKLMTYSWPGNIRELEHIVERALIISENEALSISDLVEPYGIAPEGGVRFQMELLSLAEIERRHITKVLEHVRWRIRGKRGAAELLGLKPSTLEFRMKKLNITRVANS